MQNEHSSEHARFPHMCFILSVSPQQFHREQLSNFQSLLGMVYIKHWKMAHCLSHFLAALSIILARCPMVAGASYFDVPLDPKDHLHLYWDVYYDSSTVALELHVRHVPSSAWIALGFSDYGESTNADLCVLWTDRKGKPYFQDVWTDDDSIIHVDHHQDCKLADLQHEDGVTILVFRRKFDTCDDQDYIIEDGTTHVLYSVGKGPLNNIEGMQLTKGKFGFQRMELLKNLNPSPPPPEDVKIVEVTNKKVHVPSVETTYWCSLHKLPKLTSKHHIIQYEAVIQPGNEALVHHMELFHCEVPSNIHLPDYNAPCESEKKPPKLEPCKRVLAAWAMGASALVYPEEAGAPIGGTDFSTYAMLEVHYNNPQKKNDWIDSSGVRLHYTSHLRKYDIGVMELGLQYTDKMAIPPQQPGFVLSGHCIMQCTYTALPPDGIIIFASQLHTHLSGVRVLTRHIRGGIELPLLNGDNHYSPHFQEIRLLKKPVNILPGDALLTSCTYKTVERPNVTVGGLAISDEMCVNYVHYYPKWNLEVCKSSIDTRVLDGYFRFLHNMEHQPTSETNNPTENYHSIEWTPARSQLLHDLYVSAPLSMQCNQSNGDRFPGYWENMNQIDILQPLQPTPKNCPVKSN